MHGLKTIARINEEAAQAAAIMGRHDQQLPLPILGTARGQTEPQIQNIRPATE